MQTLITPTSDRESELRHALEAGQFHVFYQPLIAVKDDTVAGFEALVRWNHPERGMIAPAEFLDAAEETGAIVPIGEWVMRSACGQVRQWQDEFGLPAGLQVGVNLSPGQLRHPNLSNAVEAILAETGFPADCLVLELSERTLMLNPSLAVDVLSRLHTIGVRTAMDDFGLGYSSLGALGKFPLNYLKLDRPFVQDITANRETLRIAATIVAVATRLGIDTIAEGVEDQTQAETIRNIKCRFAQGYHYSSPLGADEARAWLAENRLNVSFESSSNGNGADSLTAAGRTERVRAFPANPAGTERYLMAS